MATTSAQPRGRILGIGGVFFTSPNKEKLENWYRDHLGIDSKPNEGAQLHWRSHDNPQKEHVTVWSIFPDTTKHLSAGHSSFMINYIVDDMDALLDKLRADGVRIDPKREDYDYGRFAWIYDPDGNKIELWQPL
ncbi:MAG TPA: VOC family protein [Bryobacteraceae bacterium]|jgi:catechol 2,3-dioxygenase-like lactoylglutathione lyase family enzyme|nr:VOC family protein [Bryobacteraceae bacterium]